MQTFIDRLKQNTSNPSELSKLHIDLAYEFARLSDDYEKFIPDIVKKKTELMTLNKTSAKADQMYDLSPEGQWEKKVKIKLKAFEKLIGAVKRRMETLDGEAHNQY